MAKKAPKKAVYPTKRTLNLAIKEKSPFRASRLVPLLLIILVAAFCFSKFAVVDRINEMNQKQAQAAQLAAENTALTVAVQEYPEVYREYIKYSVDWMDYNERTMIDRTDALDIIEKELVPYCAVRSVAITGNTASLQLSGITLQEASGLVQNLVSRDDVADVAVFSADTNNEQGLNASIAMLITMEPKNMEGGAN